MTQQETTDADVARYRATLTNRDIAARKWERQAQQMSARLLAECAAHEATRRELDAMRRTATDIADERSHIATERLQLELRIAQLESQLGACHEQIDNTNAVADLYGKQLADCLSLIGTETPIAALTLAATWRAEKSYMQERIAALEAEHEGQAARPTITPIWDETRCRVCGWPLVERIEDGCIEGNCSMRPPPKQRADVGYVHMENAL